MNRFIPRPTGLPLVDAVFELVKSALDSFQKLAVTDDHLVTVLIPGGPDVRVYHGLAAPVRSWSVVRLLGSPVIVYEGAASADPTRYLNFNSSGTVTVTLRFN